MNKHDWVEVTVSQWIVIRFANDDHRHWRFIFHVIKKKMHFMFEQHLIVVCRNAHFRKPLL
jgi:hypothetical protein